MVKVGKASEAVRELAEEGEDRATDALLSDYSATPAAASLRTARTPMAQTDRVLQVRLSAFSALFLVADVAHLRYLWYDILWFVIIYLD